MFSKAIVLGFLSGLFVYFFAREQKQKVKARARA